MSRALRQPALGRAGMEGEVVPPRHFLDLCDFEPATLRQILDVASGFKQAGRVSSRPLAGRTLAMIFERPSTRTRVSFEVAMRQLGGDAVVLSGAELQLGRGETIGDTARALSRYVDAIMLRTNDPAKLHALAEHASVQLFSAEHFVRAQHPWTCTASPIHDPRTGEMLGVVDLSGPAPTVQPTTVALVHTAVRLAETGLWGAHETRLEGLRAIAAPMLARSTGPGACW